MDWKPGISHSQLPIQLLYQIQTQIQGNLPAERWRDGLAGWHFTHTITLSVAILDTNTNRSKYSGENIADRWKVGLAV